MRRGARRGAAVLAALMSAAGVAGGEGVRDYRAVGDAIPEPLAEAAGDAVRGREAALDRRRGNCVLCHAMPDGDEPFRGDAGPDLTTVGGRLSAGQMRLRIVAPERLNPDTIMPAYYRVDGLNRVAREYRGKPVLTALEIEDVIAYLVSLRSTGR